MNTSSLSRSPEYKGNFLTETGKEAPPLSTGKKHSLANRMSKVKMANPAFISFERFTNSIKTKML